jgi:hypothetical protein
VLLAIITILAILAIIAPLKINQPAIASQIITSQGDRYLLEVKLR